MTPRPTPDAKRPVADASAQAGEPAVGRPLILVDIDGVLNVVASSAQRRRLRHHEGWRQQRVELPEGQFLLFWNPAVAPLLLQLAAETGAELAWGTTWEQDANLVVGPLMGLPELPFVPVAGFPHKASAVVPWTGGRPFVWFDDESGAAEITAGLAGSQPHLVVQVDEREGLSEKHLGPARDWLLRLNGPGPGKR